MVDFAKLFKKYNIDFTTKQSHGYVNTKCIYCGGDSYKLGFNIKDEFCTCFACGSHSLEKTIGLFLNLNSYTVKHEVLPKYRTKSIRNFENKKSSNVKELILPTDTFIKSEREYLLNRRFNPDKLHKKYGVVGGGIVGDFAYRIILPLFYKGNLVSWTGRTILSKEKCDKLQIPRYYNLSVEKSVMNPKDLFFNMDNCFKSSVMLVEGPFDCLRMGDNCICSFGTGIKDSQIELLANNFNKVYIAFDDETEAQHKARKLGMNLSSLGLDVEIVNICEEFGVNDPAELLPSQVEKIKTELDL